MSLETELRALAPNIGGEIKALAARVTSVESRTQTVVLTQAEYDALSSPDANVVYVIIP